jgi:hypothetical protein
MSHFETLYEYGLEGGSLCMGLSGENLYVARLEIDGQAFGAVAHTEEDTISMLARFASDPPACCDRDEVGDMAVRVLQAALDEVGFDNAVSLLESLNRQ